MVLSAGQWQDVLGIHYSRAGLHYWPALGYSREKTFATTKRQVELKAMLVVTGEIGNFYGLETAHLTLMS